LSKRHPTRKLTRDNKKEKKKKGSPSFHTTRALMLRSDRYIRHVTPFVAHSRFGAAMIWQKLSCCPTSKCVGIFSVSERRFYTTEGAKAADSSTQCATPSSTASTSVINIKSTEEYQKLVLEASKTKPIIVDCYAEYVRTLPPLFGGLM